jgi:FG-GAP repeat
LSRLQLERDQIDGGIGFSVASGDTNGDGLSDVIVGAPSWDVSLVDDGVAVLYEGSGSGRLVNAQQINVSLARFNAWSSSGDVDGFSVAMNVTSPRGRERAKLQVESCPPQATFGNTTLCRRFISSAWTDLNITGNTIASELSGLTLESLQHWRVRALFAPINVTASGITAPLAPIAGPWRRMQAKADVADARISDVMLKDGFE